MDFDQRVQALWDEGSSINTIRKALHTGHRKIRIALDRLGITQEAIDHRVNSLTHQINHDVDEQVYQMWKEGATNSEITAQFHISDHIIGRVLDEKGIAKQDRLARRGGHYRERPRRQKCCCCEILLEYAEGSEETKCAECTWIPCPKRVRKSHGKKILRVSGVMCSDCCKEYKTKPPAG